MSWSSSRHWSPPRSLQDRQAKNDRMLAALRAALSPLTPNPNPDLNLAEPLTAEQIEKGYSAPQSREEHPFTR